MPYWFCKLCFTNDVSVNMHFSISGIPMDNCMLFFFLCDLDIRNTQHVVYTVDFVDFVSHITFMWNINHIHSNVSMFLYVFMYQYVLVLVRFSLQHAWVLHQLTVIWLLFFPQKLVIWLWTIYQPVCALIRPFKFQIHTNFSW